MPPCFCVSHGCSTFGGVNPDTQKPRGRNLNICEVRAHTIEDQKAYIAASEKRTEEALNAEIEEISAHLAASVLADQVTGPSNIPGGSMWSRNNTQHNLETRSSTSPHSPPRQPHSNRTKEDNLLSVLSDLEEDLTRLYKEAQDRLACLAHPLSSTTPIPFPLADLLRSSDHLVIRLETITYKGPAILAAKDPIHRKLQLLQRQLKTAKQDWETGLSTVQDTQTPSHGTPFNADHHFKPVLQNADPVYQVLFFMVLACQVLLGVSRRGCNFLLRMVQYIVQLTLYRVGPNLTAKDEDFVRSIPTDPRTIEKQLHLESQYTIYAVCPDPNCHKNYAPMFAQDSPIPIYPETCTHKKFKEGNKCGTPLLKPRRINGHIIFIPIKPFVAYSFKDWFASILSRDGYESKMDSAWAGFEDGANPLPEMKDIFDAEILHSFKGPDGQHFSIGDGEGRYVFSLCVDFFNPLGNKQAGKKKSIGILSMVCLNLPPEMRYKPENMYLFGIIPGPNEPPLDCLNHYLSCLVDELLDFWSNGVRFSRTSAFFYGRVVRCALVCVVCDLPAARKVNGFAAFAHKQMCAICYCKCAEQKGLHNEFISLGKRRSDGEIRELAKQYENAANEEEQTALLKNSGIRSSELHRLPYFDSARFVVVDAMHNLFLSLVHEHFDILGIKSDDKKSGEGVWLASCVEIDISDKLTEGLSPSEQKSLRKLINILESPIKIKLETQTGYNIYSKSLRNLHKAALQVVYDTLELKAETDGSQTSLQKPDLVLSILTWRSKQTENTHRFNLKAKSVFTKQEIQALRADICHMVTPSWLTSIPENLREPSHGKLKADQWRVLGTTYLPVSLMRMWKNLEDDPRSEHCKKLLTITLSLISAVVVASSRTMSQEKADLYLYHMQSYLNGLRDIFPRYRFLPNHHMALHLAEYLQFYGPVHAWWTFPFERLIGLLQHVSHNYHNGQFEETISKSFAQATNLRALLLKEGCPQAIKNCSGHFSKLVDPHIRNTLLTDISSFLTLGDDDDEPSQSIIGNFKAIPEGPYKALQSYYGQTKPPQEAKALTSYTIHGLTFSTFACHRGNSSILVRRPSLSSVPAQINSILQLPLNETFIIVQYLLQPISDDPFKEFPALQTSIWLQDLGELAVVRPQNVDCHFAALSFDWKGRDCVAVVSLSRDC